MVTMILEIGCYISSLRPESFFSPLFGIFFFLKDGMGVGGFWEWTFCNKGKRKEGRRL